MVKYIALQFYGLIRGFKFEHVRNNIYNRLIKPLKEQGFEVHIFWHTYDIEFDDIIYNIDKSKFNIKKLVVDKDQYIQNYLENDFKLLDKYTFPITWSNAGKDLINLTDYVFKKTYHHYGWFKFIYSIQEVNKIRNEYEKKQNIKYDWVILTSPQMEPQNTIDDLTKLNNKYMYSPGYSMCNGFYTSFFFGNPEHINYIAELYNYMIHKNYITDNHKNYIDSEPLFKSYVDKKYIMQSILKIRFNRIRYNGQIIDH